MPAAATVIHGATLVDVRTGQRVPNSTVRVRGERIEHVGQTAGPVEVDNAEVISGAGRWLIPGLIDMHQHVSNRELNVDLLPLYLAHGVTAIRDLGGSITKLRLLRDELNAGERVGPRLFFAGPLLENKPIMWPEMTFVVDTPASAESAVKFLIEQGVDLLKVYNHISEDALHAVVRTAHGAGKRVTGHVPRTMTMTSAIDAGLDCLEHIRVTGRELLSPEEAMEIDFLPLTRREVLLWERFSLEWPSMQRVVAKLASSGVFLVPTLAIDWAIFAGGMDELDGDNHGLSPAMLERVRQERQPSHFRLPVELAATAIDGFRKRQKFILLCAQAGVRLVAGTDAFGPGRQLPGVSLHLELALLTEAGLSPLQALRAATITAAQALDREQDLGSIEPGKLADIVMLNGDPLESIGNLAKVEWVMKSGQTRTPSQLVAGL